MYKWTLYEQIIVLVIVMFLTLEAWGIEKSDKEYVKQDEKLKQEKIAVIDNETINAANFLDYLSYRPLYRNSDITETTVKQRLDEMIVGEVLYQEGLRLKIDREPKVRRRIQQIVSSELLAEYVDKKIRSRKIEEKELQDYYKLHKYEFNRPEQIRLADIFIAVPDGSDKELQTEKKKKAEKALAEAQQIKNNKFGFGKLIREYSDTHHKYPLGDTGYFDAQGNPFGLDIKLSEQAFKLQRIGTLCDHVIETRDGYHVIMLVDRRPAVHKQFVNVKSEIKRNIRNEDLKTARQNYINDLKRKAEIQIDNDVIKDIVLELKKDRKKHISKNSTMPTTEKTTREPPPFPGKRD